ncbi:DUF2911 domain-containing protein [Tellurirhabdus bombi]|uniref:DUF2911 domain-containing protein n=1 Tax=Tellurirhabdus bombi TaxID=2907205 RepID=UPI001F47EA72|nr:DUF2911 domain-containing protein [Tellurirhabdus bombi]
MKKSILTLVLALGLGSLSYAQIQTPQPSPAASVSQVVGLSKVSVNYSRPSLKGRKMFGEQLPYGKVWRTGANQATKLTFSEDMLVNGQNVAAGSYALFTIPNPTEWTVILSKSANSFGSFEYKPENDVLRFTVKPTKLTTPAEAFTIEFTDFTATKAMLALRWENVEVKFPMENNPDEKIMAQIKEQTANPAAKSDVFFAAADYYYQNNRDLKQAHEWASKVIETQKEYWTYYLRGKIAAKMGDCKSARADATAGLELAKKAGDDAYITNHQRILAECK